MTTLWDPSTTPQGDLGKMWDEFIGKPEGRAALASVGLALLQPIGIGQSPMGHVAQALGAGGASAAATAKENATAEEQAFKNTLAEEKMNLQKQEVQDTARRTGILQQNADTARRTQESGARSLRDMFNAQSRADLQRQRILRDQARNIAKSFDPAVRAKWGDKDENEIYNELISRVAPEATKVDGSAPTSNEDSGAILDAPRDPTKRVVGQVYNTPRGVLKWTGTVWVQP